MRDFKRLQVTRVIFSSLKNLPKEIYHSEGNLDSSSKYLYIKWKSPQEDPPAGVSGAPGENNIMLWNAVIFGPHETPFEVDYN